MSDKDKLKSGEGPGLRLETEPLSFFHPLLVGTTKPGNVQPVPHTIGLEEEPATWPQFVI